MLRFDGLIRSLDPYLRTVAPRKSNPSSIDVILVFSSERLRGCLKSHEAANRRTINRIMAMRIIASLVSMRTS